MPVPGTCSARRPAAWGSISAISAPADHPQTRHTVRASAALQIGKPTQLALVQRDDQFAARLERDLMLFGEALEAGLAVHAELGLQRARLVVDACVQHPAVLPTLVSPRRVLFVHNGQAQTWVALSEFAGGR